MMALPFNPEGVPPALRERPQWVAWKFEKRPDGRITKVPYNVRTGKKASTTNASSWATFDEATRGVQRGGYDGAGFVFSPDDGLAGLDVDHCIAEDGTLSEEAAALVAESCTYVERSPSGTGLHIIGRAVVPGERGVKAGGLELYDRGRYFTVTGYVLDGVPEDVRDTQATFERVHGEIEARRAVKAPPAAVATQGAHPRGLGNDRELLDKARAAKDGSKFAALYDRGDCEGAGYGSHSEADLALVSILNFWTGNDAARTDQLFRGSALMRPKWDEKHGAETYGGMTLARGTADKTYTPPARVTARNFKNPKPPPTPPATATGESSAGAAELTADAIQDPEGENGAYSPGQVLALLGISWPVVAADTDTAHAHRLQGVAGDDLAFVPELGGYLGWDGRQWRKDAAGQVQARALVQSLGVKMKPELDRLLTLYSRLDQETKRLTVEADPDPRKVEGMKRKAGAMLKAYYAHARAARATESDARQRAILSSAQPLFSGRVSVRDFEPRPWVVGFQNGVWSRGEFRETKREDHLLTLAAVNYEANAPQDAWREVLDRMTGGDADLARTLQDVAGYTLSGAGTLRLVPWAYGEGGTGKSTYAELLGTVLGDMAATVDPKLFATDASRERLGATIWGRRVAVCAEAGNARLDAEALKTLSGGDRLSVRFLYSEAFTARPSHVLLMVANDAPRVEAYDEALKERVLALPFKHRLDAGGPLRCLDERQRVEEVRREPDSDLARGFTAWAVEGLARVYREQDVYRAPACETATREFWQAVDQLADFWLAQDVAKLAAGVPVSAFREAYGKWCTDNGGRPLGAQKFNKACRSVGLEPYSTGTARFWRLVAPAGYPQRGEPGQADGLTGLTGLTPVSLKPPIQLLTRGKEIRGLRESASNLSNLSAAADVADY